MKNPALLNKDIELKEQFDPFYSTTPKMVGASIFADMIWQFFAQIVDPRVNSSNTLYVMSALYPFFITTIIAAIVFFMTFNKNMITQAEKEGENKKNNNDFITQKEYDRQIAENWSICLGVLWGMAGWMTGYYIGIAAGEKKDDWLLASLAGLFSALYLFVYSVHTDKTIQNQKIQMENAKKIAERSKEPLESLKPFITFSQKLSSNRATYAFQSLIFFGEAFGWYLGWKLPHQMPDKVMGIPDVNLVSEALISPLATGVVTGVGFLMLYGWEKFQKYNKKTPNTADNQKPDHPGLTF